MNKYKLIPTILMLLIIPKLILAQQDALGGSSGIIVSIFDLISVQITVPNITSSSYIGPLWVLILGFMIGFSVIYLAAAKIPLFRDAPSKGPLKMFSIAVSLMVIFSTPFLAGLLGLVATFTSLTMIAVLVLGIYMIWVLFKGGWSEQSKDLANANKKSADAKEINRGAREIEDNAKAGIQALNRQKSALNRLTGKSGLPFFRRKGLIELDIENNKKLINQLNDISNRLGESSHVTGERQKELVKNSIKELSNAVSKLRSQTQTSVQRLGRINNVLTKYEQEELNNLTRVKQELNRNIEKINKSNLDDKEKQRIITSLTELSKRFEDLNKDYFQKIESIRTLRTQIINVDELKMNAASEVDQALRANLIPPDSAGHIQKLRTVIQQEIAMDAQLGEEIGTLEGIIYNLKGIEGQIKTLVQKEKIMIARNR